MLSVLIVDDEENVRAALSEMLSLYASNVKVCATCCNISEALKGIRGNKPDVLLLDVEIGEESGFDIFKHYPKPDFKIIFITAYQKYALQAFRFSALDYLLKPVDPDLLIEALGKVSDTLDREKVSLKIESFLHNMGGVSQDSKKIVLKTADNIHVVNLAEIMYCQADRSYTKFFLSDKSHIMVSHTMGDYEELFANYDFFRIHQSYLLNLNYLKRFEKADGGQVILKDGTYLPVATRKKEQLLARLSNL